MDAPSPQDGSPKQKNYWWIWLIVVCLLVASAGIAYLYFSDRGKHVETPKPKPERKEELLVPKDKTTVMIMGVDERHDDVGRSDTLMLATFDPVKKRMALLSIPRDTRVKIPEHGFDKINAAYAYGDEKLAQETVEDFMGIHIDHYVIVNVASFVKIIDAMGGVDVNVKERMYYEDPWDDDGGLLIDFQPGLQHMDGKKAVTYVRYRDSIGDAGRILRQQEFMRACLAQLVSPSTIVRLPDVIREIVSAVRTDMTLQECLEIANILKDVSPGSLKTDVVPGDYKYIGGICYLLPDLKDLRKTILNTLEIEADESIMERFDQDAQEYEESVPENAVPAGDEIYQYRPSYSDAYLEEPSEDETPSARSPERDSPDKKETLAPTESPEKKEPRQDTPDPEQQESPNTAEEDTPEKAEDVPAKTDTAPSVPVQDKSPVSTELTPAPPENEKKNK